MYDLTKIQPIGTIINKHDVSFNSCRYATALVFKQARLASKN